MYNFKLTLFNLVKGAVISVNQKSNLFNNISLLLLLKGLINKVNIKIINLINCLFILKLLILRWLLKIRILLKI